MDFLREIVYPPLLILLGMRELETVQLFVQDYKRMANIDDILESDLKMLASGAYRNSGDELTRCEETSGAKQPSKDSNGQGPTFRGGLGYSSEYWLMCFSEIQWQAAQFLFHVFFKE